MSIGAGRGDETEPLLINDAAATRTSTLRRHYRAPHHESSLEGLQAEQSAPEVAPPDNESLASFWTATMDDDESIARVRAQDKVENRARFDWRAFKRIWRLAKLCYFPSQCCCGGGGACCCNDLTVPTIAAIIMSLGQVVALLFFVVFVNGTIAGMADDDMASVYKNLIGMAIITVITPPTMGGAQSYLCNWLAIKNREYLTRHIHYRYLKNRTFYRLLAMDKRVDNPDQRITVDAKQFGQAWNNFWFSNLVNDQTGFIYAVASGLSFIYYSWPAVGALGVSFAFLYAAVTMAVLRYVLDRALPLDFRNQRLNADFRFAHIYARENAESIVFYSGQDAVHRHLNESLGKALSSYAAFIWRLLPADFFRYLFNNSAGFLGYIVPIVLLWIGELGMIPKHATPTQIAAVYVIVSSYYSELTYGLGWLDSVAELAYTLVNAANRVGELLEVLDDIEAQVESGVYKLAGGEGAVQWVGKTVASSEVLSLESVTVVTPDNCTLVSNLSLSVRRGESLLILGPSGIGKSSLLRVMSGLWPLGREGVLSRPEGVGNGGLFVLPQRPYLPLGDLRTMIVYPLEWEEGLLSDSELAALVESVQLSHLFETERTLEDWSEWDAVLSGGEQQRIGMARLFFHRPAFAFLDEATAAVSVATEDAFYTRCRDLGISTISISHNTRVARYHDNMLVLSGKGRYELMAADEAVANDLALAGFRTGSGRAGGGGEGGGGGGDVGDGGESVMSGSIADYVTATEDEYFPLTEATAVANSGNNNADAPHQAGWADVDVAEVASHWTEKTKREWLEEVETKDLASKRSDLNGRFFSRCRRLCGIMVGHSIRNLFSWKVLAVLALILASAGVGSLYPKVLGQVTSTLTRDPTEHVYVVIFVYFFGYFVLTAAIPAVTLYFTRLVYIDWRKSLTQYLHFRYTQGRYMYTVCNVDGRVDNPDQRIQQDGQLFAELLSQLLFGSKNIAGIVGVVLSSVLIAVANVHSMTVYGIGLCAGVYAVQVVITVALARPLVPLIFRQDRLEGDFRFAHVRLRTYAESVAFFRGADREHKILNNSLGRALANSKNIALREYFLIVVMRTSHFLNNLLGQSLPIFLLLRMGPEALGYDNSSDAILGISAAYITLGNILTLFLVIAGPLADFAGHTNRLGQFLEVLDDLASVSESACAEFVDTTEAACATGNVGGVAVASGAAVSPVVVGMEGVDVVSPTGATLVAGLSFGIGRGESLFISGPSGCGKSTILRVLGGLLDPGPDSGRILRPRGVGRGGVMFLPQKPYLVLGTLKEQVTYPATAATGGDISEGTLLELLRLVRLEHLLSQVYAATNDGEVMNAEKWADMLSGGEKQRLALCRVFFHRPSVVIMDEATSGCDTAVETGFFDWLKSEGVTFVTVSHRPYLKAFHTWQLELTGSGSGDYAVERVEGEGGFGGL